MSISDTSGLLKISVPSTDAWCWRRCSACGSLPPSSCTCCAFAANEILNYLRFFFTSKHFERSLFHSLPVMYEVSSLCNFYICGKSITLLSVLPSFTNNTGFVIKLWAIINYGPAREMPQNAHFVFCCYQKWKNRALAEEFIAYKSWRTGYCCGVLIVTELFLRYPSWTILFGT